jgi:hypothetical protein
LIALSDCVNMFSFGHDIRCDSNIIGNASPDQVLPSDFARCMLERVNMTLPARIRPNENQIACDKRVAVETCLIAVLFDVVAPVDTPSVAIQGIEIPEQDPTNSNLPTTVAEENTQPCVSNCQRIAGSDWSAFTLPKAITNSAIGRAVRPDRAEPAGPALDFAQHYLKTDFILNAGLLVH